MPSYQIRRPFGVSHSTVPTRSADPSDQVELAEHGARAERRLADDLGATGLLEAPDTPISAALAVLPSTSTTSEQVGRHAARRTGWFVVSPCALRSTPRRPDDRNWLATPTASFVAARVAAQVEHDPGRRQPRAS